MVIYRDKDGHIIAGGKGKKNYPVSKREGEEKAHKRSIYKKGKYKIW